MLRWRQLQKRELQKSEPWTAFRAHHRQETPISPVKDEASVVRCKRPFWKSGPLWTPLYGLLSDAIYRTSIVRSHPPRLSCSTPSSTPSVVNAIIHAARVCRYLPGQHRPTSQRSPTACFGEQSIGPAPTVALKAPSRPFYRNSGPQSLHQPVAHPK